MGLINLIKLANDYTKAKKFVENKKEDLEKAKKLADKVKDFIVCLEGIKEDIIKFIEEAKQLVKKIEDKIKKAGK